jgi:pseudouridylate synthase
MNKNVLIHPEVKKALKKNRPVVALESTIISHGMPWPRNAETAMAVEDEVRRHGAIPATIAIINGKCMVGLNEKEIEFLAKEREVWKVSIRDMPFVIAKGIPGATTVAATMRISDMAGIRIFATGGIGGVHRGAEITMDISADLIEMSRTNVAVVSAGVKSILDIGLTLEYLETLGIPVLTVGQDEFPAFYTPKSDYSSPLRSDDPAEIASMLNVKWKMGLNGSVLIANPVQADKGVAREKIEKTIRQALSEAELHNIQGKEITPFLLKYIAEHSGGESLDTNIELIKRNAALAALIACAYAELQD